MRLVIDFYNFIAIPTQICIDVVGIFLTTNCEFHDSMLDPNHQLGTVVRQVACEQFHASNLHGFHWNPLRPNLTYEYDCWKDAEV